MSDFKKTEDDWAIILKNVFPDSNLIVSTPVFVEDRTKLFVEGNKMHLEAVFEHLAKLPGLKPDEICFGKWEAVMPPDPDVIIYYRAFSQVDKIQLLSLVLREHLIRFCNLRLSEISHLIVIKGGHCIFDDFIPLPERIGNGAISLPNNNRDRIVYSLN
ncbi:MAG: hypothetical protein HY764_03735 [Candidatus Portnoybacteria bacterium]|nr:hypothetical protein [Candidatus Portnoybacteria bacterium]